MADSTAGALTFQFKADLTDLKRGMAEIKTALSGVSTQAQTAGRQVQQGMEQARQATDSFSNSTRQSASVWASFTRGFVVGSIATAFAGLAKMASDYIDQLKEMSAVAKKTYSDVAAISGLVNANQGQGISSKTTLSGIDALGAKANTELREGEGELSKLLEANNMKLVDRQGKLKSVNDLLMDAATLVREAGSEYDKIDIARIFGLSEEWVKVLERGPEALRQSQVAAQEAGGAIDREMAQKAQVFTDAWNTAWENFKTSAKQAIDAAAGWLGGLIQQARSWRDSLSAPVQAALGIASNPDNRIENTTDPNEITVSKATGYTKTTGFNSRLSKLFEPQGNRPTTKIPTDKGGGGGGGGGETADAVERYLQNLERTKDLLQQEVNLWGQTRTVIEAAKAVEAARAAAKKEGRDLTAEELEKAKQLGTEYGQVKDKLEQLRDTQQSLVSIGNTFTNAISDWALNGTKAADVFKNLARSIANMALQATLMGSGPLAGLFGTKASGGGIGGLFGALLGGFSGGGASGLGSFGFGGAPSIVTRASGGPIAPNGWSWVGEQGPELIRAGSSGASVLSASDSASAMGGGGPGQIVVTVNGARGNQEINSMVQQGVTVALREYDRRAPAREQERMLRFT